MECSEKRDGCPDPHRNKVGFGQQDTEVEGQHVAEHVLNRMSVHSGHGHRGCPLVVLLVDKPVQELVVQQTMAVVERYLGAQDTDRDRVGDLADRRK